MVIPLIQSSETSAAIALNKINDEIANGTYIPLGAVIVSVNHSHGKEFPNSDFTEYFSNSDMDSAAQNKPISVVTRTGKVYQYNYDKTIYFYGNVNTVQSINSNNFEIKTEKFTISEPQIDSNRLPMKDQNGNTIYLAIPYEKVIVFPKK